jgi:hypothetical protein
MIVPIEDTYLNALSLLLESEKLDSLLQETNAPGQTGCGIIWAVRKGTTSPELSLAFKFNTLDVLLRVMSKDSARTLDHTACYADGIDDFLPKLRTFLRANRLAAPKR